MVSHVQFDLAQRNASCCVRLILPLNKGERHREDCISRQTTERIGDVLFLS